MVSSIKTSRLAAVGIVVVAGSLWAVSTLTHQVPAQGAPVAAAPSFDVGSVIDRVHFGFRAEGTAFKATHSTWSVERTASGTHFTAWNGSTASPGWEWGTTRISRGALLNGTPAALAVRESDGSLETRWGSTVERLGNGPQGIHHTIEFASAPAGTGALNIELPMTGLDWAGQSASGHHFASKDGLGFVYGNATWVDAANRQWPVTVAHSTHGLTLEVPAAVLAQTQFPAVLDPFIGPEFAIDRPMVAPTGTSAAPSVAFDGTSYLVVWQDLRSGESDIYAAQVSAGGRVLNASGIPLCTAPGRQVSPVVAFGTDSFLVAWQDYRSNTHDSIYAATVTTAGVVQQLDGFKVTLSQFNQALPSLAFDGTRFLAVWQEESGVSNSDIVGARIQPNGTVQDTGGIVISAAQHNQSRPRVAFDGTRFLAVWVDSRAEGVTTDGIYGARIDTGGAVLDPAGIELPHGNGAEGHPGVTRLADGFLVAWSDYRMGITADIYGTRIQGDGTILDPAGIVISNAAGVQSAPSLAFNGTAALALWSDGRNSHGDIYTTRIAVDGTVLDPTGVAVSTGTGTQSEPVAVWDGTRYFAVWQNSRTTALSDVMGARIQPDNTVLDPMGFPVSTSANAQYSPALAFDGTQFLAVWADYRAGNYDIYGARIQPDGIVLDTSGFVISGAEEDQFSPAVVFDGAEFFVVWADNRNGLNTDIYGARVRGSDVSVLDPFGFPISTARDQQLRPSVAYDGHRSLVIWEDHRGTALFSSDIYGARVENDGTVIDALGFPIAAGAQIEEFPRMVFSGNRFLVVWADGRATNVANRPDIYGARVQTDGIVVDTTALPLAVAAGQQTSPSVAFDGDQWLVVWADSRSGGTSDVFGARVGQDGVNKDPNGIALSSATGDQYAPVAAWDGLTFFTAWNDYRQRDGVIYGTRISSDGGVVDTDGLAIAPADGLSEPTLARGNGSLLAAYSRFDPAPNIRNRRVRARFVDFIPPAAPVITAPLEGSETAIRPTITGTAEPRARVFVYIDGLDAGFSIVSRGGEFALTVPTNIPPGDHTLTGITFDQVDNPSAPTMVHIRAQGTEVIDAGTDAGTEPTMMTADAGNGTTPTPGCGCQSVDALSSFLSFALALLALRVFKRV